jgi:predicted GNAT family acetyltransferase
MEIKNEEHHHAGVFYIDNNGNRLGEMRYLIRDNVINIYHTEVGEQLQGHHIGEKLVEAGVNFARENHLKILPTCVFARSVFNRVKAYADVLVEI